MPIHVPESKDYPKLPVAAPIRVRIDSVAVRLDEKSKFTNEDGTPKERIQFVMSPVAPDLSESRIWASVGSTWSKKGNLVKVVRAALGYDLDNNEKKTFDLEALVGKELVVFVKYEDDSDYARVFEWFTLKETAGMRSTAAEPAARAKPAAVVQPELDDKPEMDVDEPELVSASASQDVDVDDIPF